MVSLTCLLSTYTHITRTKIIITRFARFGTPLKVNADSQSNIGLRSDVDAIIWDEAPLSSKNVVGVVDILLRRILDNDLPFGGKIVIFSGDFRRPIRHKKGLPSFNYRHHHQRTSILAWCTNSKTYNQWTRSSQRQLYSSPSIFWISTSGGRGKIDSNCTLGSWHNSHSRTVRLHTQFYHVHHSSDKRHRLYDYFIIAMLTLIFIH
jgi:hypothetical protein